MPRFRLSVPQTNNESGYLLASATVLILIVVALVSSFAFVMNRTSHFQGNYAAGERLADLAVKAHFYAQNEFYSNGTNIDNVSLIPLMNLPDNFAFAPVDNTRFAVEITGVQAAPVTVDPTYPNELKAASAYIHLSVRPTNGHGRAPSDTVALQSGASHRGMSRIGFYQTGISATDNCNDGNKTGVRWGPEQTACLSEDQANALFADLQPGDIIVPVWETALAFNDQKIIMRFPQPDRSDVNTMETNLDMGGDYATNTPGFVIDGWTDVNVKTLETKNLTMPNPLKANGVDKAEFIVKPGSKLDLNGTFIVNNDLNASSPAGVTPMEIKRGTTFTANNINVGSNLAQGSGNLLVHADTKINAATIGTDTKNIDFYPQAGSPSMTLGVRDVPLPVKDVTIISGTGHLAIADTLDTQNAVMNANGTKMNLYAAQMTTKGTALIRNSTNNLTWNVKSIDQNGPGGQLGIDTIVVNDCTGGACPDKTAGPGGPPL